MPDGTSFDGFKTIGSGEKGIGILQSVKVGPTIVGMILKERLLGPLLGLCCSFHYIPF